MKKIYDVYTIYSISINSDPYFFRMANIKMKKITDRWGVLQDTLTESALEINELRQERSLVKEGVCEECGACDVLIRHGDRFVCGECCQISQPKTKTLSTKKR